MENKIEDRIDPKSTENPGEKQKNVDSSASSEGVRKQDETDTFKPTSNNGTDSANKSGEPENNDIVSRQDNEKDQLDDAGRAKEALN